MNILTHCPICHDPLINEFKAYLDGKSFLVKICDKKLSHLFNFKVIDERITYIHLCFDGLGVSWFCNHIPEVYVCRTNDRREALSESCKLPYFEPDLTDCKKLIKKVRTYLIFS